MSYRNDDLMEELTERETEVLKLMSEGLSNREIAQRLFVELSTVRWYTRQIYSKFGITENHREAAIQQAHMLGITTSNTVATPNNLPADTTPFIGRKAELDELSRMLANPDIRLISIVAPGGMGKTRLALQLGYHLMRDYEDGVYLVSLNTVRDSDLIPEVIAQTLDILMQHDGRTASEQLIDHIKDHQLLLILDTAEHLLDQIIFLTTLLQQAPQIRIIVTSRERLNLQGESVFLLDGLAYAGDDNPTMHLFEQSAQRIDPHFHITKDNHRNVMEICELVQGMPLGIVLAAAWTEILTPKEIAAEIKRSLDFLASEQRDLPDRQRSIKGVFDYSWRQLNPEQQTAFMQLGIFQGGCTREAAQVVTRAELRTIMTLVKKNMLRRDPENGRFFLHNLLQQYAAEQLAQDSEYEQVYQAHAHYYLSIVAQHESTLKSQHQLQALAELDADFDNIRAAWQWAVDHGEHDVLNDALEAIRLYCGMRGRTTMRQELFSYAWDSMGDEAQTWDTSNTFGPRLAVRFNRDFAERCLTHAQQRNDTAESAYCLYNIGYVALGARQYETALNALEESAQLYEELGDFFYLARVLGHLGVCYLLTGRQDEAVRAQRDSQNLLRQIGDQVGAAGTIYARGSAAFVTGNYQDAERLYRESYTLHQDIGNPTQIGWVSGGLSYITFLRGDLDTAQTLAEQTVEIINNTSQATDVNYRGSEALALCVLGHIANIRGELQQSQKMFEFAQILSSIASGLPISTSLQGGLAAIALVKQDQNLATSHFNKMIAHTFKHNNPGELTLCLPIAALLCEQSAPPHHELAAELLGLIDTHPASITGWLEHWSAFTVLRENLAKSLGEDEFEAAWERGTKRELADVISGLQELFS